MIHLSIPTQTVISAKAGIQRDVDSLGLKLDSRLCGNDAVERVSELIHKPLENSQ